MKSEESMYGRVGSGVWANFPTSLFVVSRLHQIRLASGVAPAIRHIFDVSCSYKLVTGHIRRSSFITVTPILFSRSRGTVCSAEQSNKCVGGNLTLTHKIASKEVFVLASAQGAMGSGRSYASCVGTECIVQCCPMQLLEPVSRNVYPYVGT